MSPRGRYAPSPTGALHLGNARTALAAWWRARATGGGFVMRVEDLDEARSREEHATGNLAELRWLGLDWDEGPDLGGRHAPYRQSQRHELYESALADLESSGRLFRCWLSRADLRELATAPHGSAPVYGARERAENERMRGAKERSGKRPALRLRARPEKVHVEDLLHGPCEFDAEADIGDVVVRRADGVWSYQLAVVVDDLAMEVEEVVRGDDLLPSAATQVSLCRALGAEPPTYLHVPLLHDVDGERMAKRKGSRTLASLRDAGVAPERVVGLLAWTLGLLPERGEASARDLVGAFALERMRRAPYALTGADLEFLGIEGEPS